MSLFLDDGDVQLWHGDALQVLQCIPNESVHCCVTSPPFYGLRSYLDDSHADKPLEIGLEETPEAWVESLVQVFREVRRVLRPEGTLWLEVGDSYAAQNGQRKTTDAAGEKQATNEGSIGAPSRFVPDLKPKDLIGAPWMLAFALRADGWYLRSDIVWARPNPMPESVTDRPTKSHSYVFLLAKQPRYFFDQEAVREPHTPDGRHKTVHDHLTDRSHPNYDNIGNGNERWPNGGRNVRSVWNIATQPYPEAHFATFPEELARRCILAGTSERGCCPECGASWVREVETVGWRPSCEAHGFDDDGGELPGVPARLAPVPCVVLDPFVGSGTVPHVSRKHGRHAIGIDLNASYLELAARRLQQLSLFAQVTP